MELCILIAVGRWLSGIARDAGRSPFAWGTAGAVLYIGGLFVSALVVGPLLAATKSGLALFFYIAMINVGGLALSNMVCREVFNKNLTTIKSLARVPNIGGIVFASLFLIPPLMGLFVMGHLESEEVVNASPMAALCLVLVATLFVLRNGKGVTMAVWPLLIVLSANVILAGALLWYSTTLELSHPGTMSIISAYMFGWATLAAGLNVLCVGLTIRSSRRLQRRG